jgi:hypothetical protein
MSTLSRRGFDLHPCGLLLRPSGIMARTPDNMRKCHKARAMIRAMLGWFSKQIQ